ncbi:MAG: FAD:protein FMN transferase [Thermoanaerobaculia bacterium]
MPTAIQPAIASGALVLGLLSLVATESAAVTLKDQRGAMGSRFEISAVHADPKECQAAIDAAYAEIERIEAVISEWRETSAVSEINRKAGIEPVVVTQELFNLTRRSLRVSGLTDGAFDITFHTVGRLWNFKSRTAPIPDDASIKQALKDTGYRHVVLDESKRTIYLDRESTRIGFGAIGKGYAANRAVFVLKERGVTGGVINAGGDLVIFGTQEDGRSWRIGIANPLDGDKVFAYLDATEQAVVTSGDYENYIEFEGKRYSHILDPRTGYPAGDVRSVTIVCPDGELADALATGVSVLGVDAGLKLVNGLRGVEAMLVDQAGRIHFSQGLESLLTKAGVEE